MNAIQIIRDKTMLHGTCYFELLPGKYRGECWNDGSVYLEEETVGFLEPIIERHEPEYDHFSFVEISKDKWYVILADFEEVAKCLVNARSIIDLGDQIGFCFRDSAGEFASDFRANAQALAHLIQELNAWIREQLETHPSVSILGL